MQIFSHNPRQWKEYVIPEEEVERFQSLREELDIRPVFIHASYLINLASSSRTVRDKSIRLLTYEVSNADRLGVEYVILHTGSARGEDEKKSRARAAKAIGHSVKKNRGSARILLENTAGEQGDITSSMEALADIIETCGSDRIGGICLDTCHAFASGYDLTSRDAAGRLIAEIDESVGIDRLKLIHVNDSKRPLGSGVDRHEHIGKGHIGMKGMRNFLSDRRISNIPMVLETPKQDDSDDRRNLKKVLSILSNT
jgi:deoxyribonuclease-4